MKKIILFVLQLISLIFTLISFAIAVYTTFCHPSMDDAAYFIWGIASVIFFAISIAIYMEIKEEDG